MKKALLSMRVTEAIGYEEKRSSIAYDYVTFFEKLGYFLILIPNNTNSIDRYFESDNMDLVILSGGNSVSSGPNIGADLSKDVYDERNATERELIKSAITSNIPLLGICRGFQMINVYFGGALEHNIKAHVKCEHELFSDNPLLSGRLTNSYHNHGINKKGLSKDLEALAWSGDGYIETAMHNSFRILGIQWHPERQNKAFDSMLLTGFLQGRI